MAFGKKVIYKGGSFDTTLADGFKKVDSELIKSDLLTHLFTQKGERVMMPNFGTNLRTLVFEPLDDLLKERIAEEIQAVVDYDPRVQLLQMIVDTNEDQNEITVEVLLRFVELEVIDTLNIDVPLG